MGKEATFKMMIREAAKTDLKAIIEVESQAFGEEEGPVIVELVKRLLDDPTAKPFLSLVARDEEGITGHVLFTHACIAGHEDVGVSLLAPLAVVPEMQGKGIGGRLIEEGMGLLLAAGVRLVFVLGHPGYYPRYGFKPAGRLGFAAPYPVPEEAAGAWMVRALGEDITGTVAGQIRCADEISRPEYWRE